jgi:hypothetical protein
MIVDCFTFFNEFDLLELRLRTLDDVVDRFVLCEAPFTFRGEPKPLYFREHRLERFARWRDRLTVLTYPGPPSDSPWVNEWGQRDFLATALTDCAGDDLVLIGDCDEIPDPRYAARRPAEGGMLVHRMMLAAGYVNRVYAGGAASWDGTRAGSRAAFARYGTLSEVRKRPVAECEIIESGWHFSSLGGAAVMERKMRSYSHSEFDVPYFRDLRRLEVVYQSDDAAWVPLDDRFPRPLREDPHWQPFVMPAPGALPAADARRREHVHGCFAYVPLDWSGPVAALAAGPEPWGEIGRERFGTAFAGAFPTASALLAHPGPAPVVVIDGLEQHARETPALLAAAGAPVVAFATNARSFEVFGRVVGDGGAFPPGRALGRTEFQDAIRAGGYEIAATDRLFVYGVAIPRAVVPDYSVAIGSFELHHQTEEALLDFLSTAFVFRLVVRGV